MNTFSLLLIASTLTPGIEPALAKKPDILQKLKDFKPGEAVTLGNADVTGEFNETAKKWELDRTGQRRRDYSIKMCWRFMTPSGRPSKQEYI